MPAEHGQAAGHLGDFRDRRGPDRRGPRPESRSWCAQGGALHPRFQRRVCAGPPVRPAPPRAVRMLDSLRFLGTAIRRRWGLALLAVAATAALSAGAAKVFPGSWHVEVRILAQPDPVTASLANPGRMMPSDPRAQLAAA